MTSTKHQINPMTEIRNSKRNSFGDLKLVLGIYLGFEIWDLEFWNKLS
jgi:hypothetical protein